MVPFNGQNHRFATHTTIVLKKPIKAYVRLYSLRAQSEPRQFVKGCLHSLHYFDPEITPEHFGVGHPSKVDDYIRMTIFVTEKLKAFIKSERNTLPAIGGVLRVDWADEVQARTAANRERKAAAAAAAAAT